jgi:hypothetical protein
VIAILCLLSLTGCGSRQIVRTEFVYCTVPHIPENIIYYDVNWTASGDPSSVYTLTFGQAQNILKNVEMLKSRERDLINIIEYVRKNCGKKPD